MRLRALLFAVVALGLVAMAVWRVGGMAASWMERETAEDLSTALTAAGQDWAGFEVDGLKVTLSGAAPDEPSRFRVVEIARQVVAPERVTDLTTVVATAPLAPPPFALELLRNESEVSLIGLVPETGGRDVIRGGLSAGGLGDNVTDMLEVADEAAPDGWDAALGYGLDVLGQLPRAKISVAPGSVMVLAVADSDAERAALTEKLAKAAPKGVALTLDISAPRPVISPFAFDFSLADGMARLDACSADTDAAAAAIVATAEAAGATGAATCAVGLGAPSPDWQQATEKGIAAVVALGGGRFRLTDLSAQLTAPDGVTAEALTAAGAALDAGLPAVFQIETVMPPQMAATSDGTQIYAPRFDAVLGGDGVLRLTGPLQDSASRTAIESFASALFGHEQVTNVTVVDPALPEGWPARVLAGIEALSALKEGKLDVTPEAVRIAGWSIDQDSAGKVEALLAAKLGPGVAQVDVSFNAAAAEEAATAARPRPEICAEDIGAILDAGSINFAAGSADIVPESRGVIGAIADTLQGCPGAAFEIAGHTDSQGTAEGNRRLSEARAEAVLAALKDSDLPLVDLTAHGYGAEQPIGDNATGDGRRQNRRIEFVLVPPGASPPGKADAEQTEAEAGAAVATGPDAVCVAAVGEVLAGTSIQFESGSSRLTADSRAIVASIGDVLEGCADARIEVAGYTDSQGSEAGNLRLSQERARAVVTALRTDARPLLGLTAKGYGAADPVAGNDTAEGRAQNRRITFTPRVPDGDSEPAAATAAAAATDPVGVCLQRLDGILVEDSIQFAAGAAEIAPESAPIINALAGVLRGCPDAVLEVGGFTDSQGADAGNLDLSQARAAAVLAAVKRDDLPLAGLTAKGYGEADPIADNATPEGRALNRRIAFQAPRTPDASAAAPDQGTGDDGSE